MRAVALYATGSITISSIKASKTHTKGTKGKEKRAVVPAIIPPISDSEKARKTVRPSIFSARGWQGPTASFYKLAAEKIDDDSMLDIINQAKEIFKASRRNAREADSDFDPDDSILQLGNGSDESSDVNMDPLFVSKQEDDYASDGYNNGHDDQDDYDDDEDDEMADNGANDIVDNYR